jgi:DNA-directed RNA polymerase specialized sigma24 family protein
MDCRDVINALLLWIPRKAAQIRLCHERSGELQTALECLRGRLPRTSIGTPEVLSSHLAAAIGRGYLQSAVELGDRAQEQVGLHSFMSRLEWNDLVFAAACAAGDEQANTELIRLVQIEVVPVLAKRWGHRRGASLAEELPGYLHELSEKGLNRGRPRWLAYSGRAPLIAWLRVIAINASFDRCKRDSKMISGEEQVDGRADSKATDPLEAVSKKELIQLLSPAVQQAFEDIMPQLQQSAPAQFRFAYLRFVKRMRYVDIAKELEVEKSNVTRLSETVCRKLMARAMENLPRSESQSAVLRPAARALLEEVIQKWLDDDLLSLTE